MRVMGLLRDGAPGSARTCFLGRLRRLARPSELRRPSPPSASLPRGGLLAMEKLIGLIDGVPEESATVAPCLVARDPAERGGSPVTSDASVHHRRVRAAFRRAPRAPHRDVASRRSTRPVASAVLGRVSPSTGCVMLHYEEACAWIRGDAAYREFVSRSTRTSGRSRATSTGTSGSRPGSWGPVRSKRRRAHLPLRRPDGHDWSVWRYDPRRAPTASCGPRGPSRPPRRSCRRCARRSARRRAAGPASPP